MARMRALTFIEMLVALCIIFLCIGMFAVYAGMTLVAARDLALRNELANIRMSIEHYLIVNGHLPEYLADLTKEYLTSAPGTDKISKYTFLKAFRTDKNGSLLDPYSVGYGYDAINGRVWSQANGRQGW
jgi:hypothetical protein